MRKIALLAPLILAACAATPTQAPEKSRPVVALMTDFGLRDDAVSLLRGVILSIARDAAVVDVTHEVPPYDIEAGARLLEDSPGLYPPGTVFVVVVDPGVGTARKPIAVRLANGSCLIGPDNGVLSLAMARYGVQEVRVIENPSFMRTEVSTTFHGRDVFSPAGAHVAINSPPFHEIGPVFDGWIKLPVHGVEAVKTETGEVTAIQGEVVAIDEPFGNVWTNVTEADLKALKGSGALVFKLGAVAIKAPLVKTFGDVPEGKPLAYWSSRGKLSLALNMGDAARTYGVKRGTPVVVSRER
jgi:S-adenosylmethionine hydrolase